jgi:hypothetical protein
VLPVLQHPVEMALLVPITARIINVHAQLDILGNSVKFEVSTNILKVLGKIFLRHLCTIHIPTRIVAEMELQRSVMPQKCLTIFMAFFFTLIRLQERALFQQFT